MRKSRIYFWEETRQQVNYYVKELMEDALDVCRQEAAGCLWQERSELRSDVTMPGR